VKSREVTWGEQCPGPFRGNVCRVHQDVGLSIPPGTGGQQQQQPGRSGRGAGGRGDNHRSDGGTAAAAPVGRTATFAESVTVLGDDDVAEAVHPFTPNGFVASTTVAEDSPDEFRWEGDMVSVSHASVDITNQSVSCYVASHSTAPLSFQLSSTLRTLLHHPPLSVSPRSSPLQHLSLWLTLVPLITCFLISLPSFHIGVFMVFEFGWEMLPLLQPSVVELLFSR
jgi:hypothetical protein